MLTNHRVTEKTILFLHFNNAFDCFPYWKTYGLLETTQDDNKRFCASTTDWHIVWTRRPAGKNTKQRAEFHRQDQN